jgi:hypothetical protein
LALLEQTLVDAATPDGYKQWLLERIGDFGGGEDAKLPCAAPSLLARLLASDRLGPEAWALCFQSLASAVMRYRGCAGVVDLDLLEHKLEDPEFLGYFSALRALSAAGTHGETADIRQRARALFWRYYDTLAKPGGRFSVSATDLDYPPFEMLYHLVDQHPMDLDRDLLTRALTQLKVAVAAGVASEQSASPLLSILRERPDLRPAADWEALHAALLPDSASGPLREGCALAIACLLPYAPQWVNAELETHFLAMIAHSDSVLVNYAPGLPHGGATAGLAACAIYGGDEQSARRILAKLLSLAMDAGRHLRAQSEAIAALEAIVWNRSALADSAFKAALHARLGADIQWERDRGADRVLDLLELACALHPERVDARDRHALRSRE